MGNSISSEWLLSSGFNAFIGSVVGLSTVAITPLIFGIGFIGPAAGGGFAFLQSAGLVTFGSVLASLQSFTMTSTSAYFAIPSALILFLSLEDRRCQKERSHAFMNDIWISGFGGLIGGLLGGSIGILGGPPGLITGAILGGTLGGFLAGEYQNEIRNGLNMVWNGVHDVMGTISDGIQNTVQSIGNVAQDIGEGIQNAGESIRNGTQAAWNWVTSWF